MRLYATALTGMCSGIIAFDILWISTKMDAFEILFMAMMVGFAGAVAFLVVAEKIEEKQSEPGRAVFVRDEETTLEYMPMRKGRVA